MPLLSAGTVLQGRYTINRVLGQGGFGVVYAAQDNEMMGAAVAVKQLAPQDADPRILAALEAEFQREALVLRNLNHPRVPRVYSCFESGSSLFLVMDYIEGKPLSDFAGPRLSVVQVREWATQICSTLAYLHSVKPKPVVHRDLKPDNILLSTKGIVLIDFGIAKSVDAHGGYTTHTVLKGVGTSGFAAPEVCAGEVSDPSSDIYALGATLYTLLTGQHPVDGLLRQQAVFNGRPDPLVPISAFRADVPDAFSLFIESCMALRKSNRYRDGAEALNGRPCSDSSERRSRGAGADNSITSVATAVPASPSKPEPQVVEPPVVTSGGLVGGCAYIFWMALFMGILKLIGQALGLGPHH